MGEFDMKNIEKYNEAFKEGLEVTDEALTAELAYNTIPSWDSVGHMKLIAEIEETFDIMFETEDIIDFSSYDKGKELLKKYDVEL